MSILLDYHRLSPAERQKVTKDQATWDKFSLHLIEARNEAMKSALDKLKLDGLSKEERFAKINAALKEIRDPKHFNMEKDWHTIAYLLTGKAKIKEEHLPNAPLHNVIFGGLKTSVQSGYGPVCYFDSKLVTETVTALVGADRKVIAVRYDPAAMKKLDLYALPDEKEKKGVLNVVEELTAFFQQAVAGHEDVIKYVW